MIMNTRTKSWIVGIAMLFTYQTYGQALIPWFQGGNTITTPGFYVGCDGTSSFPLQLRTIPDLEIQILTSDIERFRLLPDNTYATLGGYSGVVANGFALLSPDVAAFYTNGAPGPYSQFHLAGATNNAYDASYRDDMQVGVTLTGDGTHGYVGLRKKDAVHTDLWIQVAKRDGATAPDRIRFGFATTLNTGATSGPPARRVGGHAAICKEQYRSECGYWRFCCRRR